MPIFLLDLIESEEDKLSISQLYEKYKNYMFAIALDMSGDPEIAADSLQESFISIISIYDSIRDYNSLQMKAYLRAVIRSRTLNIIRFNSRVIEYETEFDENTFCEDINYELISSDDLADAILSIKPEYREILLLKYVNQMKLFDIAKTLDISHENAKKRLLRAKNSLRIKLEAMYE